MTESLVPPVPGDSARPGQTLRLASLAPRFDGEQHQIYFDLLQRAVDDKNTRNIALTGAYGTGKSSILEKLRDAHGDRVVGLSLSTIGKGTQDTKSSSGSTVESTGPDSRTNQIQKEIVKQLLYKLPPEAVPNSRFHRASAPDGRRDWIIAALTGACAFILLVGLGLVQPIIQALLPELWRQIIAYVLVLVLAIFIARVVVVVIRSRPSMSASVQAGAATVTLSKQSNTYFDEYLDEIVYFFQMSKANLVVIEDIDRFEDVHVFDTLRALNGLLNSSRQVSHRVVFIYAIRDSVFEQIGSNHRSDKDVEPANVIDHAKEALKRASRTKFFDVIIPVVPFVSADNARDVMSDAMKSTDFEINPALIRLAARHVADMRMIHNIRNEFEVYRNRLIVTEDRVPGIDDDLVFAIVLFKNTHLADFEKIRHRDSSLDVLYSIWRSLVKENLKTRSAALTALREKRNPEEKLAARATYLGQSLTTFVSTLQTTAGGASVELVGPVTAETINDHEAWSQVAAGTVQQVSLRNTNSARNTPVILSFSAAQLETLLHVTMDAERWGITPSTDFDSKITEKENQVGFLRHHTWEELCNRPEFKVDLSKMELTLPPGETLAEMASFAEVIDVVLSSELARSLVKHGFLTSHFALHASTYYGNHLGPEPMEYIRRCIEPGVPDTSFLMSEDDVVQLLRDQDADKLDAADLFEDPSVFNVSILDYLLSKRPGAAAVVAQRLARAGELEREFLDVYTAQGAHPGALLSAMAKHWPRVVQYAAVEAPVDSGHRPSLVDEVLRGLPSSEFDVSQDVGRFISSRFREIPAVTSPTSDQMAVTVLGVLKDSNGFLDSLEPLNEEARTVAVRLQLFPMTFENLRVLVPEGPIALDILRPDVDAYSYALNRLEEYLDMIAARPSEVIAVRDGRNFAAILADVSKCPSKTLLGRLVELSDVGYRVDNLTTAPTQAWPYLAMGDRWPTTFENVSAYIEQFDLDENLGLLFKKHKRITDSEQFPIEERAEVALAVLSAAQEIPSTVTRVQLAVSLKPGVLDSERLQPESGDLVARLLKRRLIADTEAVFQKRLMLDWATWEKTILASKAFASLQSPAVFPHAFIPNLLLSDKVPAPTKLGVVNQLRDYLPLTDRRQAFRIADALVKARWRLPYSLLEAIREAGASSGQMVNLIASRGEDLPTAELKMLLVAMGGKYEKVAAGGRGRPTFPPDEAHRYVLGRLVGDTINKLETESFKLKGTQIVASLRKPVH